MSDNSTETGANAPSDDATGQDTPTGRAGGDTAGKESDRSERSGYSYSTDPVTGERLGGDLSDDFNDRSAASASASDLADSAQGQAERSSGSSDTGSAQAAAAGSDDDLPDYARETYRTEDDVRADDTHRSSQGFTHGM